MKLITIYTFQEDKNAVQDFQNASNNPSADVGLKITENGLIGSTTWWSAVNDGKIQKVIVEGKISKVYKTGHNDFDQFDIDSNGEITSWAQYGNWQYYEVGKVIRLTYVVQPYKKLPKGSDDTFRVVISVEAQKIKLVKEPFDGFEIV